MADELKLSIHWSYRPQSREYLAEAYSSDKRIVIEGLVCFEKGDDYGGGGCWVGYPGSAAKTYGTASVMRHRRLGPLKKRMERYLQAEGVKLMAEQVAEILEGRVWSSG